MIIKYKNILVTIITIVLIFSFGEAQARGSYEGEYITISRSMPLEKIQASKETCIQCHSKVTPRIVDEYKAGAHRKAGLDCVNCHDKNHKNMPLVTGKKVCIKCHKEQTKDMLVSKHGASWKKMWDNARYWSQPKAIRQQGCSRCHDISYGFNDVRCDYCHTTHEFSVEEAKEPSACTTCHMGPDHPQAEAYEGSAHGLNYKSGVNKHNTSPTCVTCHLVGGSHNVSKNTAVCNQCHNPQFNKQWLEGADQVKILIDQQLLQAQTIVKELYAEGLLFPNPDIRERNPMDGQRLVLGGNQLYVGTSKAEAIYFKMYKFAAAQGWKSAYHQDFRRAGNSGIKEMQILMGQLQDEAKILRLLGPTKVKVKENLQDNNTKKDKENIFSSVVVGLLLGILLLISLIIFKAINKRRKGNLFLGLFILTIVINVLFGENKAIAWNGFNKDQRQCITCHARQGKELEIGKHSGLTCLNCHEPRTGLDQVRKPETCGKCHSGSKGFQLETYLSSPHGVQYKLKGMNKWVPTCVTCHMPRGVHNPKGKLIGNDNQTKGNIVEVCLQCHITDDVIKFNQDKLVIYQISDSMAKAIKEVGFSLINKDILIPKADDKSAGVEELKKKWGNNYNWTMVNIKNLSPEEQAVAKKLIIQLDEKTKEGINVFSSQMRIGTAHINPDYAHWYGNANLNLTLSDVQNTAIELEMLAQRAGYTVPSNKGFENKINNVLAILFGIILLTIIGYVVTIHILPKIRIR